MHVNKHSTTKNKSDHPFIMSCNPWVCRQIQQDLQHYIPVPELREHLSRWSIYSLWFRTTFGRSHLHSSDIPIHWFSLCSKPVPGLVLVITALTLLISNSSINVMLWLQSTENQCFCWMTYLSAFGFLWCLFLASPISGILFYLSSYILHIQYLLVSFWVSLVFISCITNLRYLIPFIFWHISKFSLQTNHKFNQSLKLYFHMTFFL